MLAYLFWHRPRRGVEAGEYEEAQRRFHTKLEVPSACFRLEELPFEAGTGYEDWYLVEDWQQLGELNALAVDAIHRPDHDRAATLAGEGWGAVYASIRGPASIPIEARWQHKRGDETVEDLLAEVGNDTPVWRRQLVLGPAPEFCIGSGGSPRHSVVPLSSMS